MRKLSVIILLAYFASLLTSCEGVSKGNGCSVKLEAGKIGQDFISFTISPVESDEVAYMLLNENDMTPDAEYVFSDGLQADNRIAQEYKFEGLRPSTVYKVVAASRKGETYSDVAELLMKTSDKESVVPTIVLKDAAATSNTVTFTIVPNNAANVAYMVLKASESEPESAEYIISEGSQADAGKADQYTCGGLDFNTDYVIYAAAVSVDDVYSDIQELAFVTDETSPANMGDYYYSDGTWSSGDEEPIAGKQCIGIVIMSGRSTISDGEDTSVYRYKDNGDEMSQINGYAIALHDAVDGDVTDVAWGSWDVDGDDGVGTSYNQEDFNGYYNTVQIINKAIEKNGGLSDDPVNNYPAAYMAVEVYESEVAAPVSSSGWFLPSAQQLEYVYKNHEAIHKTMDKLNAQADGTATYVFRRDAIYWSSTEAYTQNGCRYWSYMVNMDEANINPGYVSNQQKTKEYKVRSMLVF